mmetsp:Transcript_25801/g.43049  ORF Transcript_25801/g.43049 Transcript_25801/m.43049 type:complete len:331 (+) Transcript_25801:40-1032(+)
MFALTVFVPVTHSQAVREALADSKAGAVRNYDSCSFTTPGTGRFRPLEGASPTIGSIGAVEVVEEDKIETVVLEEYLTEVLRALKVAHPYEEPAIHLVRMVDYNEYLVDNEHSVMTNAKSTTTQISTRRVSPRPISVVLEGLDGVGKSTVAKQLAEKLQAKLMVTPPPIMQSAREWFVNKQQDPAMRKAYYMVGNFIAGAEMKAEVEDRKTNVVLDRYYTSTLAYIKGKAISEALPPAGDTSLDWPSELYKPTYVFVLVLPEAARLRRRQSRVESNETSEEALLREDSRIPERINRMYELLGCHRVDLLESEGVDAVVDKLLDVIFENPH